MPLFLVIFQGLFSGAFKAQLSRTHLSHPTNIDLDSLPLFFFFSFAKPDSFVDFFSFYSLILFVIGITAERRYEGHLKLLIIRMHVWVCLIVGVWVRSIEMCRETYPRHWNSRRG